jgi:hypothetical protein
MANDPPSAWEWGWRIFSLIAGLAGGFFLGVLKSRHERREAARDAFLSAAEPLLFAVEQDAEKNFAELFRTTRGAIETGHFQLARFIRVREFSDAWKQFSRIRPEDMALTVDPHTMRARVKARSEFLENLGAMIRAAKQ